MKESCTPGGGVPTTNELLCNLGFYSCGHEEVENNKHIVLYIGANWCDDCTGYLPTLKRAYDDDPNDRNWEVVYVSSDTANEEYQISVKEKHGKWLAIPFEDVDTRVALKKKHRICARREADELRISERRDGLSCMLWIGGGNVSHEKIVSLPCIVTRDIQEHGAKLLSVKQQQGQVLR